MKKRKLLGRLMCFLVATLTAVSFCAPAVQAKTTYSFNVTLNAGINNQLLVGYGAPFYVTVENTSASNFEGQLQMIVPGDRNENIMYARDISLGVNEKKTALFNAGLANSAPFVNIRLANKKGKVEYETLVPVTALKDKKAVRVGVMTDDFTAVSYMDRQHFLSDDQYYTEVTELTKDNLSEVGRSLDMYDVIVISDYSTDLLSEKQIEALQSWTAEGGFLIIGTGSTANKTLSGFNGSFVKATVGNSEDIITTLGMENEDYTYVGELQTYMDSLTYSYSTYGSNGDPELDEFYQYKYYNWYYPEDYDLKQGVWSDSSGNLYDENNKKISPDYYYLFDDSAFYSDPLSGEIHYRYYDDIYGVPDSSDYSFQYEYQEYVDDGTIDQYCLEQYFNILGYDVNRYLYDQGITDAYDRQQEFEKTWGADYEDFCYHHIWGKYNYDYYGTDVRTDIWTTTVQNNSYTEISVNVREITLEGANENLEIFCDKSNSNDLYSLGKIENVGDGYLGVFGIDFTKNPIPKTAYAGDLFRSIVEKTIGKTVAREKEEYDGSTYYSYTNTSIDLYTMDEDGLYSLMASAPVPPSIVYLALLGVFLLFVLIIYLVLLKKKKTKKLWIIYPISAGVTLLLIFCISFSTRLLRMSVNTVAIIDPTGTVTTEEDYISVVAPKKKTYNIDFSKDISIDPVAKAYNSYYYYFSSSDIDYDNYKTVYYEGVDKIESIIENEIPLSATNFKAESSYITKGGVTVNLNASPDIISVGPSTIRISNNYSTDLEDVFVIYTKTGGNYTYSSNDSEVRYFDKIKAGDEVTMNSGKKADNRDIPQPYNDYLLTDYYDSYHVGDTLMTLIFGEIIPANREFVKRRGILGSAFDYTYLEENTVYVIGFPKGQVGPEVLENKLTKEHKYEAVVIYKSTDDMEVVY